ncbi:MAG: protein kinase [Kofleriaceae bacterium]|nr:protein kinase [Kofleriaceae bacterium]MCL4227564.1 protein kinase [Myxococcales bacterium]
MYCPLCRSEYPDGWKRCPTDEAALLRAATIGKYRIDRLIGAGGMGAVYRAENPDTQAAVAIKILHGSAAGQEAARARFQREAAAVAALKTRHVVSIFDFGADTDGTLYLVMEHLHGHNLRREIAEPPAAMPLPRVNLILDGALRGLGAAHRAGIVHRDLKPENVFIAQTDDGEVAKLLDFGIARKGGGPSLTHSGALMGTPAYMAPEQVAGNRGEVGPWSDVYGMGVILYEMLTGRAPFAADSMTEVLARVLAREFAPLRSVRAELPEAIYQLVERALTDDHAARFPHADALREAWQAAYATLPAEVRSATVPRFRGGAAAAVAELGSAPTSHATASGTPAPGTPSPGDGPFTPGTPASKQHRPTSFAATATPSAMVGESSASPTRARRGNVGLALAVGGVVAAGAIAIVLVARGGSGPRAAAPVDAGATADAAIVAVPVDAAAAPPELPGMAYLPGGRFVMGAEPAVAAGYPDALAQQATEVRPFYLDRTEVTAVAAKAALGLPPAPGDGPDLPARSITWSDAAAACQALGKRLPTEAEWEFAAQRSPLPAEGARLRRAPGAVAPAAVGSHPGDCTRDGVCDLLGNVMEWTADGADGKRVVRGASYSVSWRERWVASIHARVPLAPHAGDPEIGFRCARDGAP